MKKKVLLLTLFTAVFVNLYAQAGTVAASNTFRQDGIASWYGREYDGRPTASGEIFDSSKLTAAHPSLPFGTMVIVTNQHNNKSVTVRINDRGPFVPARIIDVSRAAAEQLDMIITGTAPVTVESIDRIAISPATVTQTAPQAAPAIQAVPVVTIPPRAETSPPALTPQVAPIAAPQTVTQTAPQAVTQAPVAAAPVVIQPVAAQAIQVPQQISVVCTLTPAIPIMPEKTYRLQVGSYRNARNALSTFERLKSAGLNPAYERYMPDGNNEYFRVVLAAVLGTDIQLTAEKLGSAGFREALIREEN